MGRMDPDSPMVEHHLDHHKDIAKLDYKLELVKAFRRPLERQTYEGYLISNSKAIAINRKGEWGQNLPPRFTCTDGSTPINRPKSVQMKREAEPSIVPEHREQTPGPMDDREREVQTTGSQRNKRARSGGEVEPKTPPESEAIGPKSQVSIPLKSKAIQQKLGGYLRQSKLVESAPEIIPEGHTSNPRGEESLTPEQGSDISTQNRSADISSNQKKQSDKS